MSHMSTVGRPFQDAKNDSVDKLPISQLQQLCEDGGLCRRGVSNALRETSVRSNYLLLDDLAALMYTPHLHAQNACGSETMSDIGKEAGPRHFLIFAKTHFGF